MGRFDDDDYDGLGGYADYYDDDDPTIDVPATQLPATPAMFEIASRLDTHMPGWANKIDIGRLDLSNVADCLFGQLFGGWEIGFRVLGLGKYWKTGEETDYEAVTCYNRYLNAWKDIIEACRTSV